MTCRLKTIKTIDGRLKFLTQKYGSKTQYFVVMGNGQQGWVDRSWVVKNVKHIENAAISGNNLYALANSKFKVKSKPAVKDSFTDTQAVNEAQFTKYSKLQLDKGKQYRLIGYKYEKNLGLKLPCIRDPHGRTIVCSKNTLIDLGNKLDKSGYKNYEIDKEARLYYSAAAVDEIMKRALRIIYFGLASFPNHNNGQAPDSRSPIMKIMTEGHRDKISPFNYSPYYEVVIPLKQGWNEYLLDTSPAQAISFLRTQNNKVLPLGFGIVEHVTTSVLARKHKAYVDWKQIRVSGRGYCTQEKSVEIVVGQNTALLRINLGVVGEGYRLNPDIIGSLFTDNQVSTVLRRLN